MLVHLLRLRWPTRLKQMPRQIREVWRRSVRPLKGHTSCTTIARDTKLICASTQLSLQTCTHTATNTRRRRRVFSGRWDLGWKDLGLAWRRTRTDSERSRCSYMLTHTFKLKHICTPEFDTAPSLPLRNAFVLWAQLTLNVHMNCPHAGWSRAVICA